MDESTLVYSVYSGHGFSFTPQRVFGAKRIIISQQKHVSGVQSGFVYENRLYKGSSLNTLPTGVYRDRSPDVRSPASCNASQMCRRSRSRSWRCTASGSRTARSRAKLASTTTRSEKNNVEAVLQTYVKNLDKQPPQTWTEILTDIMLMFDNG